MSKFTPNSQIISGLRSSEDNWPTYVDTEVLSDETLSPEAKLVFSLLCMIAGFGHRSCTPYDEVVAEMADMSVRALYRAYYELETKGLICRSGYLIQLIGHNAPCYNEEDDAS